MPPPVPNIDVVVVEPEWGAGPAEQRRAWGAPSARTIALTPSGDARAVALASGFDGATAKPIAPRALAAEIASLLR